MENGLNNNQENTAKDNIQLNRRNTMREIMNEKKAKQRLQRRGKRTHENPTQRLMNITKEEFNIGNNTVHKPPVHKNDGNQVKDGSWFDDYNNQLESVEREISLNDSKQDFYDYIGIKKKANKQKKSSDSLSHKSFPDETREYFHLDEQEPQAMDLSMEEPRRNDKSYVDLMPQHPRTPDNTIEFNAFTSQISPESSFANDSIVRIDSQKEENDCFGANYTCKKPEAPADSISKKKLRSETSSLSEADEFHQTSVESTIPGSNDGVPPEISKLFNTDGQPQKPDKSSNRENSRKDKLTLSSLEHELISKLRLIRHEDGIYYFNGRTYVAIRNNDELLELFRSEIDDNAYGVSSTKIFQDLFQFMKTSKKLVPLNYEKRLKKSRNLVVLKNGVVDLTTCRLMDFNPEYLTFYELDANWTEKKPRYFEKFLQSASGEDEEIMTRTKEVMGYLLSGSNEGKVFFVIGTAPNSGKSTLAQFLKKVIDPQFIAATAPGNLGERFALGTNRSVILNIALDVPSGKLNSKAVSMLKSITGNDAITIEQKYMRPETIVSNTRFLFGTNYPIQISSDEGEDAFWDRMCIIPFEISVSESDKDPELLDHLIKEKDAIVSECLRAVQKVIYHKYQFSYCGAAEELKAKWRNDIDSHYTVNWFFRECVNITCNMNDYELTENVYDRYIQFCKDKGLTPERITQVKQWIDKNCSKNECYYTKIHTDGVQTRHVFRGLRLIC